MILVWFSTTFSLEIRRQCFFYWLQYFYSVPIIILVHTRFSHATHMWEVFYFVFKTNTQPKNQVTYCWEALLMIVYWYYFDNTEGLGYNK